MFSIKNWYGQLLLAKIPPTLAAASITTCGFSFAKKTFTACWFYKSSSLLVTPTKFV
jgi:hypothetical protein